MAPLTANLGSKFEATFGNIQTLTLGPTADEIFRGATVVIRLTDGYAYPAEDDPSDTLKQVVVGIARENKSAADGDETVRVETIMKIKRLLPGAAQEHIGKLALVKDDQTVQTYSAGVCKVVVGRISSLGDLAESVFVDLGQRPVRLASSLYE
jgi:hypothetical protein